MPLHRDDLLARTRSVGPAAGTYQLPAAELAKLAGSSPVLGISGVVWSTVRSAADNAWTSLCWSPQRELLVAASSSGTGNRIMTSADGLSWTVPNSPADLGWARCVGRPSGVSSPL
jgi:hypothetical protein